MMLAASAEFVEVTGSPEARDQLVRNARLALRRYG